MAKSANEAAVAVPSKTRVAVAEIRNALPGIGREEDTTKARVVMVLVGRRETKRDEKNGTKKKRKRRRNKMRQEHLDAPHCIGKLDFV